MKDLTIIDFSHNSLRDVPSNVEYAKCAIVLNLSHNNIENIPNPIFNNLIDLIFLDLSYNKLDSLPGQLRRLVNLQVLNLSNNPLKNYQLSSLRFVCLTKPFSTFCVQHEKFTRSQPSKHKSDSQQFACHFSRNVQYNCKLIFDYSIIPCA